MGKKRHSTGHTSKGERRSTSRKMKNAMHRDKVANPTVAMMAQQDRMTSHEKKAVTKRASELFKKYEDRGAKWSACVQAVKTNWIPQFETRWSS